MTELKLPIKFQKIYGYQLEIQEVLDKRAKTLKRYREAAREMDTLMIDAEGLDKIENVSKKTIHHRTESVKTKMKNILKELTEEGDVLAKISKRIRHDTDITDDLLQEYEKHHSKHQEG